MIKKLLKSVREYKKASILSPVFVTFEVIMEVIIPLVMSYLIDRGVEAGNMNVVYKCGAILVGLTLVSLTFGALSGKYAACASAGFAKNLRKDMYYKVQKFSFFNIDKFSTSSLVTRLTTDVTNVQNAYQMIVRIAVRAPIMLVSALIMATFLSAKLSMVFLVMVPVLGGGLFFIAKSAHPIFESVFKTYDKLNLVVQENLYGIRVVKAFVREETEKEKFDSVSEDIYKKFSKAERIIAFNSPLMQFAVYGSILLISWFSAKFIVGGSMTTGQLISMITYTMQILMSLMMLSMIFVMIIISRASAERICEVLDEEPTIKYPENPIFEVKDGSIEFDGVSFGYKEGKSCLKNINIKINSGETVGIIGGTGSAKSSLVQLIPRLYDVTEGELKVGGENVKNYDIKTLRDNVSMVLQKNVLFSGTINENLKWGDLDADEDKIKNASQLAAADGFVESFPDKYETYIEQGGTNVSGGQKQRLCIARALLKNPKILILDDSTSAVDTKTDAEIRKSFREYIPDVTKIIIAQRISSVQDADKIIVMDNGEISAVGTHEELLKTSEIYKEVYYSQVKGAGEDAE